MKKNLRLSQFFVGALLIGTVAPVSGVPVDQPQKASVKQNIVRRLLSRLEAKYKELKELRAKRKAGTATPEELKKLEEQMRKIKRGIIITAIVALFLVGFGSLWWLTKPDRATRELSTARVEDIARLIQEGADPDIMLGDVTRGRMGLLGASFVGMAIGTPLNYAARRDNVDAVRAILNRSKKSLNVRAPFGGTPLTNAARAGHTDVVRELLAHGADPTLRDYGGKTPQEVAKTDEIRMLIYTKLTERAATLAASLELQAETAEVPVGVGMDPYLLDHILRRVSELEEEEAE